MKEVDDGYLPKSREAQTYRIAPSFVAAQDVLVSGAAAVPYAFADEVVRCREARHASVRARMYVL